MPDHESAHADLTPDCVRAAAAPWGLEVRHVAETGSTNADAAAWAPDAPAAGGLVVADHQTAGRGRLGRTWVDTPGACLLFSLLLPRPFDPTVLGLVPLAAGVALCRAARAEARAAGAEGFDARLKWPNDLMVSGRKAAGILCESATGAGPARWIVVGVGVNVNGARSDLPPDLREAATSLGDEAGRQLGRCRLLASFLEAFLPLCDQLERGKPAAILGEYRALCETLGTRVSATTASGVREGTAVDVHASGALVLDSGDVLHAADVVHLLLPRAPSREP
jgi:BirA family biotin operon repressor/biotin-[acetyl-CoA-carboxylase] ligase